MPRQRVVEVEESSESSALLWGVGGVLVGAIAGILIAERMSGKPFDRSAIIRRIRQVARLAGAKWEPLLALAMSMREAWAAKRAGKVDESLFEADEDEYDVDEDESDESDDPTLEGDEFDDEDIDDDVADAADDEIGRRVLEAFENDPVLAERSVEIESDDRGRVVLHGDVRTSREVAHAVTIAGGVPGVTDVRQRLSVRIRR